MIAGCIDKRRRGSCGGCEQREACAEIFPALFRSLGRSAPDREAPRLSRSPFLSFLGGMAKALEARAERAAPARARPLRAEVERRLEPRLASGNLGIADIARDLGFSRQTLYRRLKAEGITYERLLDGLRHRLALRALREGQSVKEAAYRLGFSDPAAFSRAFKRWTGSSPKDLRTRH